MTGAEFGSYYATQSPILCAVELLSNQRFRSDQHHRGLPDTFGSQPGVSHYPAKHRSDTLSLTYPRSP